MRKNEYQKTNEVVMTVLRELKQATSDFGKMRSTHEGYAIIKEEFDEMWEEIKRNNRAQAKKECIQVAAMALRFLVDL